MSPESNKQQLAVVLDELDPNRGPDVRARVGVPEPWLVGKASIRVVLPRLAACAACDGGGCELCSGQGALPLRGSGDAATEVEVHLSPTKPGQALVVRLPDLGPEPSRSGRRGCVLLEVGCQPVATKNVTLVTVVTSEMKANSTPWLVLLAVLLVMAIIAWVLA